MMALFAKALPSYKRIMTYHFSVSGNRSDTAKMTLNFVIPFNIVLEISSLAAGSYAYHYNKDLIYSIVDQIFIGTIPAALLCSCVWLAYFYPKRRECGAAVAFIRRIEAVILMILGGMTIYNVRYIAESDECRILEEELGECQKNWSKFAAGVLTTLNGFIYVLLPSVRVKQKENPNIKASAHPADYEDSWNYDTNEYFPPISKDNVSTVYQIQTGRRPAIVPEITVTDVSSQGMRQDHCRKEDDIFPSRKTGFYGLGFYGNEQGFQAQQQIASEHATRSYTGFRR